MDPLIFKRDDQIAFLDHVSAYVAPGAAVEGDQCSAHRSTLLSARTTALVHKAAVCRALCATITGPATRAQSVSLSNPSSGGYRSASRISSKCLSSSTSSLSSSCAVIG